MKRSEQVRAERARVAHAIIVLVLTVLPGRPPTVTASSGDHIATPPVRFSPALPLVPAVGSEPRLATGKFLVASRQLRDPNFSETVVLLISYEQRGAMGVVINRPTEVRLSKVLPEMEELKERTDTVYLGGPVARDQMLLLVRSGKEREGTHRVFEDVYVSSRRDVLREMVEDDRPETRFRVFAGHAGWAPGQLDAEVSRGGWHVVRAEVQTVFDEAPSEIWPRLIRGSAGEWVMIHGAE